jgi:imidazoleglycerol-phosphate dehydratase
MTVVTRETKETTIRCELTRGSGLAEVSTGNAFLDHMLAVFAKYSGLDLRLTATGDLAHHLIEDVAICLGAATVALLAPTAARYGDRTLPMDEALVQCAIDMGGRAFYQGPLPSALYDHWMRSFAENAKATIHLQVLRGTDKHHIVEAAFKAVGLAIRDAFVDSGAVFSTKGGVALKIEEEEI